MRNNFKFEKKPLEYLEHLIINDKNMRALEMNRHPWFLESKTNPRASIRLFCFHHSGGAASIYYPWIEMLSPNIEMILIQFPGRENRFTEPLINNLQEIVAQLTEGFSFYKDKPFFVFGHSLGALIAFEFIKSVHLCYSVNLRYMIVSAAKAPHLPFRMKHFSKLDNKTLIEELKIYNGIDERILGNDELLELFLPIIKNDLSVYETYQFIKSKPLPCDILTLSGIHDQAVSKEEILEWSAYTTQKFDHLSFPGKHFFIKENQQSILTLINQIGDRLS